MGRSGRGSPAPGSTGKSCAKQSKTPRSCSTAKPAVRAGGKARSTYCALGLAQRKSSNHPTWRLVWGRWKNLGEGTKLRGKGLKIRSDVLIRTEGSSKDPQPTASWCHSQGVCASCPPAWRARSPRTPPQPISPPGRIPCLQPSLVTVHCLILGFGSSKAAQATCRYVQPGCRARMRLPPRRTRFPPPVWVNLDPPPSPDPEAEDASVDLSRGWRRLASPAVDDTVAAHLRTLSPTALHRRSSSRMLARLCVHCAPHVPRVPPRTRLFPCLAPQATSTATPPPARSRCRARLDQYGDHRAACPCVGPLRSQGILLERAAARFAVKPAPPSPFLSIVAVLMVLAEIHKSVDLRFWRVVVLRKLLDKMLE